MSEISKELLFSVVIPIDDGRRHLDATLSSIVGQTIGFADNIEVLFVGDAKNGPNAALCASYAAEYPDNVQVFDGAGDAVAACSSAIKHARGLFLNVLDADVAWDAHAFETASVFLREHPETAAAAGRMVYPGLHADPLELDYRFSSTRVLNIFDEWDMPQLTLHPLFVKKAAVRNARFEPLQTCADHHSASEVIMGVGTYALLGECECTYLGQAAQDPVYGGFPDGRSYAAAFRENCARLFAASKASYGYVIPYAQYAALHELWLMMRSPALDTLSPAEKDDLKAEARGVLASIGDKAIVSRRQLGMYWKLYLLAMKHDADFAAVQDQLSVSKSKAKFGDSAFAGRSRVVIERLDADGDALRVEGRLVAPFSRQRLGLQLNWGPDALLATLGDTAEACVSSPWDGNVGLQVGFSARLPREASYSLTCAVLVDGSEWQDATIGFGSRLRKELRSKRLSLDDGTGVIAVASKQELRYDHIPRPSADAQQKTGEGQQPDEPQGRGGAAGALRRLKKRFS